MSVRRNSNPSKGRYYRKGYKPKVHRLSVPYSDNGYKTLCNLAGLLENHEEGMFIRTPADHRYTCTDVETEVTCVKCVRVNIGAPVRQFTHIRRASARLGLLKG